MHLRNIKFTFLLTNKHITRIEIQNVTKINIVLDKEDS